MFRTEDRFSDLESLLKERFGLDVITHVVIEKRQVIETSGRVGMSEHLFPDLESLLKERLGLGVIAHMVIEKRQVIETSGRVGTFRTEHLSSDFESLPQE